jgi:histone H3/H4
MTKKQTKAAKPAAKTARKKLIAKAKPQTKQTSGISVQAIVHKVNPKLNLTEDAIELLNALLTEKFTQIAQAASQIVTKGHSESLGCKEVKAAVRKVF